MIFKDIPQQKHLSLCHHVFIIAFTLYWHRIKLLCDIFSSVTVMNIQPTIQQNYSHVYILELFSLKKKKSRGGVYSFLEALWVMRTSFYTDFSLFLDFLYSVSINLYSLVQTKPYFPHILIHIQYMLKKNSKLENISAKKPQKPCQQNSLEMLHKGGINPPHYFHVPAQPVTNVLGLCTS